MKKIFSYVMIAGMALTVVSCGGEKKEAAATPETQTEQATQVATQDVQSEEEATSVEDLSQEDFFTLLEQQYGLNADDLTEEEYWALLEQYGDVLNEAYAAGDVDFGNLSDAYDLAADALELYDDIDDADLEDLEDAYELAGDALELYESLESDDVDVEDAMEYANDALELVGDDYGF